MKAQATKGVMPEDGLSVSVPQAAKLLGIGRNAAYALTRQEGFPAFRVGNRTLVSVAGLAAWVDRQAAKIA